MSGARCWDGVGIWTCWGGFEERGERRVVEGGGEGGGRAGGGARGRGGSYTGIAGGRRGSGERWIVESYEKMRRLVAEVEEDVQKAIGGNKAAGTRVRQVMQEIKDLAQVIRKEVLEMRKTEA